jgi:hypothetical protein
VESAGTPVLGVLNLAADRVIGEIDLGARDLRLGAIRTGAQHEIVTEMVHVALSGYGNALDAVEMTAEARASRGSSSRR